MRVVSVLAVADPAIWNELAAHLDLDDHVVEVLDAHRRVVDAAFERDVLPRLGNQVLVRYARRDRSEAAATQQHLAEEVAALRPEVRRVLFSAQRHALDDVVVGRQAWDPEHDAPAVRALHGAGLMMAVGDDEALPYEGRYQLHADLPPPPPVPYDFTEAVMPEDDDLSEPSPGPLGLLHDMASLAAAMESPPVKVTHAGTTAVADAKRVGRRLASADLAESGRLEDDPRWGRALRGLEALHMMSIDPLTRLRHLDLGLEAVLAGETEDACDRLVHRLMERDLHVVVPAVREALRQAGDGAIDEMIFLEELRDQHRDVLFPAWHRDGIEVYPTHGTGHARPYDEEAFDRVEARMVGAALARMARFGLVRRAPGMFAATPDGRRWAQATAGPHPPIWVTGDLEFIVPPDALTPWERFQVERLGRCLQRDVVDRYQLRREGLVTWMSTHDADEALALLQRRCPAVPHALTETVTAWAQAAERIVLTRGVILPDG